MHLQNVICCLALILFAIGYTSVRRVIPVNLNQSRGERQETVARYSQSQVGVMKDIISKMDQQLTTKQQKNNDKTLIDQQLGPLSINNYQQQLHTLREETKSIQEILLSQKASINAINHIQECFTLRKGKKLSVNGKDVQKLINLLRKDYYGLNNTMLTVHDNGKERLRVNSKVFSLKHSIKELVMEIRNIIETNYGGTFDQICGDNDDLTYSLQQSEIDKQTTEQILRKFRFLEQQKKLIELELIEIEKALRNDTESIYALNKMIYEKQIAAKWNYAEEFEQTDFVKCYFKLKQQILVKTQQWKSMITAKKNESDIKRFLQQLVKLRAEYNEKKQHIQQVVCVQYQKDLVQSVPEIAETLKTELKHYLFEENRNTLQETIMYKHPIILHINENMNTGMVVDITKVPFEKVLGDFFLPNVSYLVYRNDRGYVLYHSLNQAHKFVDNMKKLSRFWCDHKRIISFLKECKAEQLFLDPPEKVYIILTTINHELGQLLAWLNVFGVPWNNKNFGKNILMYFVDFTRYRVIRGYVDIRQQLLLWKEIAKNTKLSKVNGDSKAKTEMDVAAAWWFVLFKMGFSF